MLSPISVTPLARGLVFQRFHERLSSTASLQSWMNEHGEYFAIDETASSHQFPILLDNKGCPSFAAVCDFLVRMEVLEELHRPRRVNFRVADPNGLAY
jgi:hypothetical protein